jgi:hypothetical protein
MADRLSPERRGMATRMGSFEEYEGVRPKDQPSQVPAPPGFSVLVLPHIFYQPHPGDRAGRTTPPLPSSSHLSVDSIRSVPSVYSVGLFQPFSVARARRRAPSGNLR